MDRREFVKRLGSSAVALTVLGCKSSSELFGTEASKEKPNVVIIFTDDQGYGDVGCFGAKGYKTPNLDKMADEGVRFTDFHVASSVCTPSRAALMTGCYPQRVSLPGVLFPSSKIGISAEEETIAELLKRRGYATGCFGKWHLGHHPEFLPTRHGFDEYFGLPYSNDMRPNVTGEPGRYPDLPLIDGESIVGYNPDQSQLTTWYTERAVKFIKKNKDQPFFLYLPHSMPHIPLYVSEKYKGKSEKGIYGDVISEIDWSVGEVLKALKESGVDDNTLVIFTSDNGPWLPYGDHAGSAGPLREGKSTTFEGGQREPCIMRWPTKIAAGIECRELATTMDILPTVVKLAGGDAPEKKIDGKDIWPLMAGRRGAKTPHEAFYYYHGSKLEAVRSGKWKLHFEHSYRAMTGEAGTGGRGAGQTKAKIELSLFDLDNDIGETRNVADENPEVVERLKKLGDKMRAELGDELQKVTGNDIREPGKV